MGAFQLTQDLGGLASGWADLTLYLSVPSHFWDARQAREGTALRTQQVHLSLLSLPQEKRNNGK